MERFAYGAGTNFEFTRKFEFVRQELSNFSLTSRDAIGQCVAQLLVEWANEKAVGRHDTALLSRERPHPRSYHRIGPDRAELFES